MTTKKTTATVIEEFQPLDETNIHGVTFDGKLVWFARNDELIAFDPEQKKVVRQLTVPGAGAGTAFDGKNIWQLAGKEILLVDTETGDIIRRIPAPTRGEDSGMAYGDGYLWVGHFRGAKVNKVDPRTGEIVKTFTSDRFVTGVSCVEGQLWHAASEDGKPSELRRLAADGTVEEVIEVPVDRVAGMERTKDDRFWCAGGKGKLRVVRRA